MQNLKVYRPTGKQAPTIFFKKWIKFTTTKIINNLDVHLSSPEEDENTPEVLCKLIKWFLRRNCKIEKFLDLQANRRRQK